MVDDGHMVAGEKQRFGFHLFGPVRVDDDQKAFAVAIRIASCG